MTSILLTQWLRRFLGLAGDRTPNHGNLMRLACPVLGKFDFSPRRNYTPNMRLEPSIKALESSVQAFNNAVEADSADIAEQVVAVKEAKIGVEAAAVLIKTQNEMLGSVLDILA